MNFDQFLKIIPKILKENLPGELAHQLMAPEERIELMKNPIPEKHRKAAVLVLIFPKDDTMHLALILRASYSGTHSSQVAFPGGKVEKFDIDYEQTARRETFEEIGIKSELITTICALSNIYIPPSNFMVYPYLGYSSQKLEFALDSKEVAGIIEFPLLQLLDESVVQTKVIATSYSESINTKGFRINNYHVWGATAMMLNELKIVLKNVY
jgi:8-oxo-dGTP pyrophosphatase MutT (NUDIX family)